MKNDSKTLILVLLLLASCTSKEANTIRIGADYGTTGNVAQYGEWVTKGINLAVKEINEKGGISGKKIEIFFEDNQGQPSQAVTAYQKLKTYDGVKYIITYQSSIALAVAPLANQDKIIQMDVSATTPKYSTPDDYTFRTGIVATKLGQESANIIKNKLNASHIGILYINNDFGKGMTEAFKNDFKGNIVAEESFDVESTDFRTQLLKIKNINPDYIFLVAHLKEGSLLLKQARELGFTTPFFSDMYSIEGQEFIDTAKEAAEGLIYVATAFDAQSANPAVLSFVSTYKVAYGQEPNYFSAQAYDGLQALAKALQYCAYEDTNCVQKELMKLDFEGASGCIKFDINGDVEKPVELKTVRKGRFVRLNT